MNLGLCGSLFDKLFLFLLVNELPGNRVEFMRLPVGLSRLSSEDVFIHLHLLIVVLHIPIRHHVVVSLAWDFDGFASDLVLLCRLGALFRRLEMVLSHVDVADDVVVDNGVFARAEVPRLLLRVVWSIFKSLQFVLEVQDVVRLLIPECSVLFASVKS